MQTDRTCRPGRIVGGILDPRYERSYYSLFPCPCHHREMTLDEHRACDNFGGIHFDPEDGTLFLHCRFEA